MNLRIVLIVSACLPAQNCAYEDGNLMQKVDLSSYEYEKLKFLQVLSYLFNL